MLTPPYQFTHLLAIRNSRDFEQLALSAFKFQYANNKIYKQFCNGINFLPEKISKIEQIPFLPIPFFKTHRVITGLGKPQQKFVTSGTTTGIGGIHEVLDVSWYESSFLAAFKHFYGSPEDFLILGLLPNYLERKNSSLIYMVSRLITESKHPDSNFFLYNHQALFEKLKAAKKTKTPTILIGVSYALLDFLEEYKIDFPNLVVMETGGMKGKRKELVKCELHEILKAGFGVQAIHSEYGMTELLSQAYSKGKGIFETPKWMKVLTRDSTDPLTLTTQKAGGINVIDLANIHSCCFLATEDLGKITGDNTFEILGRFDQAEARGCNLLIA